MIKYNETKFKSDETFIFVNTADELPIDIQTEKLYKINQTTTYVYLDPLNIEPLFNKFISSKITLDFTNVDVTSLTDYIAEIIYLNDNIKNKEKPTYNITYTGELDTKHINAYLSSKLMIKELVMQPAIELNPHAYAEYIKHNLKHKHVKMTFVDNKVIQNKFKGLATVARGSIYQPQLIKLNLCTDSSKKKVTIVGKGITFDTGGFNLKTGIQNYSKADMTGSATALAIFNYFSLTEHHVNLEVIVCIAENSISNTMMLPGDIIVYNNGTTIEVTNTDAEGRLILADGVLYANENKPDLIIDIATLTGAARSTFGNDITAFMTNDNDIAHKLTTIETKEHYWQLPLHLDYRKQLNSDIADYTNHGGPLAGTIIAGLFIHLFVGETKWLHLDIASTSRTDLPNQQKITGVTLQPLIQMIINY